MPEQTDFKRVAFSPGEFAKFFGKCQTWGYRQIYSGKVKAITAYGRFLIPVSEVERILASAEEYSGLPPTKVKEAPQRSKEELQSLAPQMPNAWQNYLQQRRKAIAPPPNVTSTPPKPKSPPARGQALARLTQRPKRTEPPSSPQR